MKLVNRLMIALAVTAFIIHFSCKKEFSCESCPINQPPNANAGNDTTALIPYNLTLDGSQSTDPEDNIVKYKWTKISGPDGAVISNATEKQTLVTNLSEGTYQFELVVTDAFGSSSKDTVQIAVMALDMFCNRDQIQATLVPIATLSMARTDMVVATAGNKILFAGGKWNNQRQFPSRVDIYDISTNTFTTAELSEGRADMAVASVNNKIMFAGGWKKDSTLSSGIDVYDATTNQWSVEELPAPRYDMVSVTLGNKVFFAGGEGSLIVHIYDNGTGSWSTGSLSIERSALTATALDGKIYFAGGYVGSDNGLGAVPTNPIDIYDAATNTWKVDHLQYERAGHTGIALDSRIFWAGGRFEGSNDTEVEIKNMKTGEVTFHCLIHKFYFAAVTKEDNIVFFTGYGGNQIFDKFDIYNITSDKWYTGILDQKIVGAAVISVNNVIYVAGGTDGNKTYNQLWKLEF